MRCVDGVYTIVKLQFSVIEENKVGSTGVGRCKHAVCRIDKAASCPQPGPSTKLLHYCTQNMGILLHYFTAAPKTWAYLLLHFFTTAPMIGLPLHCTHVGPNTHPTTPSLVPEPIILEA